MPDILDDKSEHCIPFILERLKAYRKRLEHVREEERPPFFLGLNGVQGAGKTTLVTTLRSALTAPPYAHPTAILSIDDLYLPHTAQGQLAQSHPLNPLIQHRGQPGTHDVQLGIEVFEGLRGGKRTRIPSYDKGAFGGEGDRTDPETWEIVNGEADENEKGRIEVVVFEGWCVGFRALPEAELKREWEDAARLAKENGGEKERGRLGRCRFEDVRFVNEKLRAYDALTDDAENTQYVYQWRLEQEAALRARAGVGMTDKQVLNFVDGYYPAYELYTDTLRAGVFNDHSSREGGERNEGDGKGRQLRLIVGRDRKVKEVIRL
ncbi:MAG: hypothetical protein M1827_003966 [Pycnora praestabilis]|nr:MAG: hypothetical protein M1827_003966 [Pycnora praestabilis]